MTERVTFVVAVEFDGKPSKTLKVDDSTSSLKLKELAAKKFNIPPDMAVTLEYFEDKFQKWFEVDERYKLADEDTLRLTPKVCNNNAVLSC